MVFAAIVLSNSVIMDNEQIAFKDFLKAQPTKDFLVITPFKQAKMDNDCLSKGLEFRRNF